MFPPIAATGAYTYFRGEALIQNIESPNLSQYNARK